MASLYARVVGVSTFCGSIQKLQSDVGSLFTREPRIPEARTKRHSALAHDAPSSMMQALNLNCELAVARPSLRAWGHLLSAEGPCSQKVLCLGQFGA